GDNPYSFLLKPSFETMALQMAELAVRENADRNRNAMIFYEDNPRDSAFAAIFSNYLEENGFEIVWQRVLGKGDTKRVTDTLSAQYDRYLTQEQADSIQALPRRFVRNRRIRRDEMARMTREADRAKTNPNYK